MLVWADKSDVEKYSGIFTELEIMTPEPKLITIGGFKVWEYPFVCAWLEKFSKSVDLGRKVRVMEFGCGRSPFPQFLVNRGFEVWGVDNDSWNFKNQMTDIGVNYWVGNVMNFDRDIKFDAIVSCSVIEHIPNDAARIKVMKKLRSLLYPHGKMLHAIDFYYPEFKPQPGRRINFYDLCKSVGFGLGDLSMCPGSPGFNFENVRNKLNLVSVNKTKPQSRIAIGDDI